MRLSIFVLVISVSLVSCWTVFPLKSNTQTAYVQPSTYKPVTYKPFVTSTTSSPLTSRSAFPVPLAITPYKPLTGTVPPSKELLPPKEPVTPVPITLSPWGLSKVSASKTDPPSKDLLPPKFSDTQQLVVPVVPNYASIITTTTSTIAPPPKDLLPPFEKASISTLNSFNSIVKLPVVTQRTTTTTTTKAPLTISRIHFGTFPNTKPTTALNLLTPKIFFTNFVSNTPSHYSSTIANAEQDNEKTTELSTTVEEPKLIKKVSTEITTASTTIATTTVETTPTSVISTTKIEPLKDIKTDVKVLPVTEATIVLTTTTASKSPIPVVAIPSSEDPETKTKVSTISPTSESTTPAVITSSLPEVSNDSVTSTTKVPTPIVAIPSQESVPEDSEEDSVEIITAPSIDISNFPLKPVIINLRTRVGQVSETIKVIPKTSILSSSAPSSKKSTSSISSVTDETSTTVTIPTVSTHKVEPPSVDLLPPLKKVEAPSVDLLPPKETLAPVPVEPLNLDLVPPKVDSTSPQPKRI